MGMIFKVLGMIALVVSLGMGPLWAQEEEEYYSYSKVSNVDAEEIDYNDEAEYDYEEEEDVE